jgi:hypothetical protein
MEMTLGDLCSHAAAGVLTVLTALFTAPRVAEAQWLESTNNHYSIFYQAGYEKDVAFTRTWMSRAEQLMKDKYGVTPDRYYMSVYLLPAPNGEMNTIQSGHNQCCTRETNGISKGTIRLLTLSAPIWAESNLRSSLDLPKSGEDFHAKVLLSEYIPIGHYAVQDTRPSGGWRYYSAPEWFVQGLQEFDAIFHTTQANRTTTVSRLLRWAKANPSAFTCCSPSLKITDVYNGGATFMAFLAAQFGEDVHARLLRSSASTFELALADSTKPYTLSEVFDRFRNWLTNVRP